MLAFLQDYFGCMMGANAYLTPADSQGFAPHYDDIEAFVLQLEGKKKWKLYSVVDDGESTPSSLELPRFSSRNLTDEEIGEPFMEVVLEEGDLLYFPRGVVHQAVALPDAHSLHVTLSTFQKHSFGDLLEKLMPKALSQAFDKCIAIRRGLPLDLYRFMGSAHSHTDDSRRQRFIQRIREQLSTIVNFYLPVDEAVDELAAEFIHDCMPPVLTDNEISKSVHGLSVTITEDHLFRLVTQHILQYARLGEYLRVFYSSENARQYHANDIQYIEFPANYEKALQVIVSSYPSPLKVQELPNLDEDERLELVTALFEKALVLIFGAEDRVHCLNEKG